MTRNKCRKCINGHANGNFCELFNLDEKDKMVKCEHFIRLNNYHITTRKSLEHLAQMFADGCPPEVKKKCSGNDREKCKQCWIDWLIKDAKIKDINYMVKEEFGEV